MYKNTCCFFGHRIINETEELKSKLIDIIEKPEISFYMIMLKKY